MSSNANLLPSITSVINLADSAEKDSFVMSVNVKEEPAEIPESMDTHDKVVCIIILDVKKFMMLIDRIIRNR